MSANKITSKITKGFTLIELLIVIAIIGILAIAVLAALNPVEQINKSRDSASVADAEQLKNAVDRYYASKHYYPWKDSPTVDQAQGWIDVSSNTFTNGTKQVLDSLSQDTGELQPSFVTKVRSTNYNDLFLERGTGSIATTYVCFKPQSKEFNDNADEKCASGISDYPSSACTGVPGENFYCLP